MKKIKVLVKNLRDQFSSGLINRTEYESRKRELELQFNIKIY